MVCFLVKGRPYALNTIVGLPTVSFIMVELVIERLKFHIDDPSDGDKSWSSAQYIGQNSLDCVSEEVGGVLWLSWILF